ncbi:multidrug resistance efflux pump [Rhizobium sp. BK650]|uniref:HlyD family secretion protein n=1 Tax=Rhizobium sp. BK650 TaxID=2586990 RepID=UPI0018587C7E|nr:HlyD family secretion protein [Rhizobium sp. BK650]MBB3660106.1 multidrug resistance efflux pump [Rhizobium sp. BK650]
MKDREPDVFEERPSVQPSRGAPVGLDPSPDGGKTPNWPGDAEGSATEAQAITFPPKKLAPKPLTVAAMLVVAVAGVALIVFAWGLWPFTSSIVTTDNSFIRGKITVLASQVSGYVVEVPARDFQRVRTGDTLVRIDDRTYRQQLEQAGAQRDQAIANLANVEQTTAQNRAEIVARRADLLQAQAELQRASADTTRVEALGRQGVTPQAQAEQSQATLSAAKAGVKRAEAAIAIAEQTLTSTEVSKQGLQAALRMADAQVEVASINLSNTVITAPRDGQISEASVRLGQFVTSGSQLMFLVPSDLWVVANFKETQTNDIRVGQPVWFTVDALNRARLTGKVEELSPATGSSAFCGPITRQETSQKSSRDCPFGLLSIEISPWPKGCGLECR